MQSVAGVEKSQLCGQFAMCLAHSLPSPLQYRNSQQGPRSPAATIESDGAAVEVTFWI
jgi:hypothetical protein